MVSYQINSRYIYQGEKKEGYSYLSNEVIDNENLSSDAKGLYSVMIYLDTINKELTIKNIKEAMVIWFFP